MRSQINITARPMIILDETTFFPVIYDSGWPFWNGICSIETLSFSISTDIANDIFIQHCDMSTLVQCRKKCGNKTEKRNPSTTINFAVNHCWITLFVVGNFFSALDLTFIFVSASLLVLALNSRPFVCDIRFIFVINLFQNSVCHSVVWRRLPLKPHTFRHILLLFPFMLLSRSLLLCLIHSSRQWKATLFFHANDAHRWLMHKIYTPIYTQP